MSRTNRTEKTDGTYAHMKGKFVVNDGGSFVTKAGGWTDKPEEAGTFDTFDEALHVAHAADATLDSRNVFGPIQ